MPVYDSEGFRASSDWFSEGSAIFVFPLRAILHSVHIDVERGCHRKRESNSVPRWHPSFIGAAPITVVSAEGSQELMTELLKAACVAAAAHSGHPRGSDGEQIT